MSELQSLEDFVAAEGLTPQEAAQLGVLYAKLLKHPEIRDDALRLQKKLNPAVSIPELDVVDRVNGAIKPLADRAASLEEKLTQADLKSARNEKLADMVDKGQAKNLAEAREIEKFAIENKIADYERAAHFFSLQAKESARPTYEGPTPVTLPIDLKKMTGNLNQWAREEALKAVREMRGNKAA